jgi:very-short-patch-repair endonuclease
MGNKAASRQMDLAEIAARQHGVVTVSQLEAIGWTRSAISKRAGRGGLHRMHQGVYAVGHASLSQEERWMAAVLACGPGAVLSHMSAAALWNLLRPEGGPIDVSLPSNSGRARRTGIRIHRCPSLAAPPSLTDSGSEILLTTVRNRIPVTAVARTIRDLEATAPPHLVRRAIRQAQLAGIQVHKRAAVRTRRTRSDLELAFLDLCDSHGLPQPEVNVGVGRWTVDFLWRPQRLAVETDFYDYHRGSISFEDDHQRDMDLRRLGYAVHRYTGAQLRSYPAEIAAELGEVLCGGGRSTSV